MNSKTVDRINGILIIIALLCMTPLPEMLGWIVTPPTNAPSTIPLIVVQPVDTNIYFNITLTWSYTNGLRPGDNFFLWYGPQPYTFTNKINVGTNMSYTFDLTNWSGTYATHYFAVTICRTNVESDFSGQVRFPLYPPDRVSVIWSNKVPLTTVWSKRNMLSSWSTQAIVNGTNSLTLIRLYDSEYFIISRTSGPVEPIRIKVWNPLNEPP